VSGDASTSGRERPSASGPAAPTDAGDAEAAFREQVHRDLPRNYAAHLAHGLLGQTGFRLINAPTFVPDYVHLLSGSDVAVGVARGLQSLGMFLSPILGATAIEHRRKVLPVGFLVGGMMRAQVLGLALVGFFLSGFPALLAVCALLGLFGFFLGMQGVVFNFLISKVIPVERRGRLVGLRHALSGVTAAGVGFVGGRLVEVSYLGNGYAATFGVAFVLTSLGLASLAFMREPASPSVRVATGVGRRLAELPALLRRDPDFTRYFLARALGTVGRMSAPFYVVYAKTQTEVGGYELAVLTAAFTLALSVTNLLWGAIADRYGFRLVFLTALGVWILAAALLMSAHSLLALSVVMACLGGGQGGFMMASQNMVLEFGSRENLPLRIAVANSASELVAAVGLGSAGLLVAAAGYAALFWTQIAFQLAAIAWVALGVRDPRHRPRPPA
jgi:MFS family permease